MFSLPGWGTRQSSVVVRSFKRGCPDRAPVLDLGNPPFRYGATHGDPIYSPRSPSIISEWIFGKGLSFRVARADQAVASILVNIDDLGNA